MRDLINAHLHPDGVILNAPHPCDACPWRESHHGDDPATDPHGFYKPENLAELWNWLRGGERMTCHPTDPRMADYEGYEHTADVRHTLECTGSMILLQREVHYFQEICKRLSGEPGKGTALAIYKKEHPGGLTRNGMIANVERLMVSMPGYIAPDLNEPDIGYQPLGEWKAENR